MAQPTFEPVYELYGTWYNGRCDPNPLYDSADRAAVEQRKKDWQEAFPDRYYWVVKVTRGVCNGTE